MEDMIKTDFEDYLIFVTELVYQCNKHKIKVDGTFDGYKVWGKINHEIVHVLDFMLSDEEVDMVDPTLTEVSVAEYFCKYLE